MHSTMVAGLPEVEEKIVKHGIYRYHSQPNHMITIPQSRKSLALGSVVREIELDLDKQKYNRCLTSFAHPRCELQVDHHHRGFDGGGFH